LKAKIGSGFHAKTQREGVNRDCFFRDNDYRGVMKALKIPVRLAVLLAVSFSVFGCATVQREAAPSAPDRPQKGKGLVIFYREGKLQGWAVGYNIRDGEREIGGLPNGSYFVYHATPGNHTFAASTERTSQRTVDVVPGKTYYLRGEVEMGLWVGRPHLTIVDPAEGASAINGLNRVVLSHQAR
jgi:hypothetical protein